MSAEIGKSWLLKTLWVISPTSVSADVLKAFRSLAMRSISRSTAAGGPASREADETGEDPSLVLQLTVFTDAGPIFLVFVESAIAFESMDFEAAVTLLFAAALLG